MEKVLLPSVVVLIRPSFGRWVEVVEPRFANGNTSGVLCEGSESVNEGIGSVMDIAGVDADTGKDFRELISDAEVLRAVIKRGGEGDHASDACLFRTEYDFL